MLKRRSLRPTTVITIFTVLALLLVATLWGTRVGSAPLTFQDILTYISLIVIVLILAQKRGLEIGYYAFIGAFAIGFRTIRINVPVIIDRIMSGELLHPNMTGIEVQPVLRLHPTFLVIFFLLGLLLLQRSISWRGRVAWKLPPLLLIFSLFWIWAWVRGLDRNIYWVDMFIDFMPFLMLIPVFILSASVLHNQALWKPTFVVLLGAGTVIALLGYLEYTYPDIRFIIPGFISDNGPTFITTQDGFVRAEFSFWGQSGAGFIVALTMPSIIALWAWYKKTLQRVLLLVCLIFDVLAIYIAGWRSLWALMILITIGLLLVRGNWIRALLFVGLILIAYTLLPATTQARFETLLSAFQGNFQDHSTLERFFRAEVAYQSILNNPLGMGWSGSGLVHNDFLQVMANQGIIGGIVFIAWYVTTLVRISRAFYESPDPVSYSLVGAFMVCGGLFMTQPMVYAPQYAAPVWLVWALVETKLGQIAEKEASYDANKVNRAYPYLQLPGAPAPVPGVRKMGR